MTHDEMIKVIIHHENCGKIEYRSKLDMTWRDAPNPWWDFDEFDYRVKPEPLVIYGVYQNHIVVGVYECKETAEFHINTNGLPAILKKFVEVTE